MGFIAFGTGSTTVSLRREIVDFTGALKRGKREKITDMDRSQELGIPLDESPEELYIPA